MTTIKFLVFINELSKLKFSWRLDEEGKIITGEGSKVFCPAIAVERFSEAARCAVFDFSLVDIYLAADNGVGHDPSIRFCLLKACGLTEINPKPPEKKSIWNRSPEPELTYA